MFLIGIWDTISQTIKEKRRLETCIFCEQNIGDLRKNSATLTWFYPRAFDFVGFIDSVSFMSDPVDNSSVNSSAVPTVSWFTACKARTTVLQ